MTFRENVNMLLGRTTKRREPTVKIHGSTWFARGRSRPNMDVDDGQRKQISKNDLNRK